MVVVDSPDNAHLEWNISIVSSSGIHTHEVNKAWVAAARIDDGVDWQLG